MAGEIRQPNDTGNSHNSARIVASASRPSRPRHKNKTAIGNSDRRLWRASRGPAQTGPAVIALLDRLDLHVRVAALGARARVSAHCEVVRARREVAERVAAQARVRDL